eukprot:SAG11_NODE_823_length_6997_cov_60.301247_5_plen_270_part_00
MATFLGAASLAAATTGVGLSTGEITTALKVHKEAYQQDKRFFYASYTEAVAHHGEAYAQAERIHAQSYAHAEAQYWQGDKHHRRTFEQAKLQHRLSIDLAMRAEIREGLRDEFGQKNNRYNALMICQTVMLTCSFQLSLVEPAETAWRVATYLYTSTLGLSIGLLTLSLWANFILTRRLNQYTAGVMHVEMHQNEDWRRKMGKVKFTGAEFRRVGPSNPACRIRAASPPIQTHKARPRTPPPGPSRFRMRGTGARTTIHSSDQHGRLAG